MVRIGMNKLSFLILILLQLLSPGCATMGQSIGAGAGAGAMLGAGIGALADPGLRGRNRIRNVLIGTAIGGVVGAGTGYLADRTLNSEKDAAYQKGKADLQKDIGDQTSAPDGAAPTLIPAKTESRWVPDQIRGQIFIPGHFEYIILEGSRWQMTR